MSSALGVDGVGAEAMKASTSPRPYTPPPVGGVKSRLVRPMSLKVETRLVFRLVKGAN